MSVDFRLDGMKALVTGGGRGIGRGIAEAFLEQGAEVVILGSSNSALETAKELQAKNLPIHALRGDLGDREDRVRLFEESLALLGGDLDILVNNSGIQHREPAKDFPLTAWDAILEVNLTAVFHLCQLAFPHMQKKSYGKIINISSLNAFRSVAKNIVAYQCAKAAVKQLSWTLADEWSEFGIRINALAPGWTRTEMTEAVFNDPEKYPSTITNIPLARWATPDDYRGIAVLLASKAGDYMNGLTIPIDGGYLAR